jgi:hypothetical protein
MSKRKAKNSSGYILRVFVVYLKFPVAVRCGLLGHCLLSILVAELSCISWVVHGCCVLGNASGMTFLNFSLGLSVRTRKFYDNLNPLKPNDPYRGRTAPLTSKVSFYIFIQQI